VITGHNDPAITNGEQRHDRDLQHADHRRAAIDVDGGLGKTLTLGGTLNQTSARTTGPATPPHGVRRERQRNVCRAVERLRQSDQERQRLTLAGTNTITVPTSLAR
jgi:hypothetical protein